MYGKHVILFLVGILLLAGLVSSLDFNELYRVASQMSWRWFLILVLLQFVAMFFQTLRWYIIVRRYAVSFVSVLKASLIGFMVNNLTPMSIVGGEPVKAYVLSKIDRIKMEQAFATVFVDLFLTLLPALMINLIALILVVKNSFDVMIAVVLGVVGFVISTLFFAAVSILRDREPSMKLFNVVLNLLGRLPFMRRYMKDIEAQVDELFASFFRSIRSTMTDHSTLVIGMLFSTLNWFVTIVRVYLIFVAIGVKIGFGEVLIVYAVLVTVSILPLIPGALGIWEWTGTYLFAYFGVPYEAAAAIVMIDRVMYYWIPIGVGLGASLHVGIDTLKLLDRRN